MSHDPDIRWLAGFIDGEGSFTLLAHRVQGMHLAIKPAFQVANTSEANIRAVKAVVSMIVGREVRFRHIPSKSTKWRSVFLLYLTSQHDLAALCEAIRPIVVGKSLQVELMLKYLASTPKMTSTRGGRWKKSGYTKEHFDMVAQMSELNRMGSQQETERVAPPLAAEETVRTL